MSDEVRPGADQVRRALVAACDGLRELGGRGSGMDRDGIRPRPHATEFDQLVDTLTVIASTSAGRRVSHPAAFSDAGRTTCERELATLATASIRLAAAIERLHRPTIDALGKVGFLGSSRLALPEQLRLIMRQARQADVSAVPVEVAGGRKRDDRAAVVGQLAAELYGRITGKPATYTSDPRTSVRKGHWPEFLHAVFAAMQIEGGGDMLVRKPAQGRRRASEKTAVVKQGSVPS